MRNLFLAAALIILLVVGTGITAHFTDSLPVCFIAGMGYGAIASMIYTYLKEED